MGPEKVQRGQGRIGLFIALIIVAAAVYAGSKFIPVYVAAYDLKDLIRLETQAASLRSDKQIVATILKKGQELNLPITEKSIEARRTNAKFYLRVKFTKPLDMALFTYTFRFDEKQTAPLF